MYSRPPSHPWFPYFPPAQSTSCYSENEGRLPVVKNAKPSNEPVAENAQHDPHYPWFLIGVTAPNVLQSSELGISVTYNSAVFSKGTYWFCNLHPWLLLTLSLSANLPTVTL